MSLTENSEKIKENSGVRVLEGINVAIIGHVDHGKTSLLVGLLETINAIGGQSTKRTYEEIDRAQGGAGKGITITTYVTKMGIPAEYTGVEEKYQVDEKGNKIFKSVVATDCPGHADFIKNMIGGTDNVDGAIIVISHIKGVQAQTRSHLNIVSTRVPSEKIVVVINVMNNTGILEDEEKEFVIMDIQAALEESGFSPDKIPIFVFSARNLVSENQIEKETAKKECLKLISALAKLEPIGRNPNAPLFAPIDNIHKIPGIGTVVTFTIAQGTIEKGKPVFIKGFGETIDANVVTLQHFHKNIDIAYPGMSTAAKLRLAAGVDSEKIRRGACIMQNRNDFEQFNMLIVQLVMASANKGRTKPFGVGYKPQLYLHKADVTCQVVEILGDSKVVNPGDIVTVKVKLENEVVVRPMEKIIVREGGLTVAQGTVVESIKV